MHTRTMEADNDGDVVEETVIVTTDIEAPKATAFAMSGGSGTEMLYQDSGRRQTGASEPQPY